MKYQTPKTNHNPFSLFFNLKKKHMKKQFLFNTNPDGDGGTGTPQDGGGGGPKPPTPPPPKPPFK
jgi:hypothetical protein